MRLTQGMAVELEYGLIRQITVSVSHRNNSLLNSNFPITFKVIYEAIPLDLSPFDQPLSSSHSPTAPTLHPFRIQLIQITYLALQLPAPLQRPNLPLLPFRSLSPTA